MAKWGEIKCPKCMELEAKLAKTVEQLLCAAEQLDAYVGHGYGDEYREAVAELTGGKDE